MDNGFWLNLDQLAATCAWRIDRPRGTPHPRYPSFVYPLDYGYLENTRSPDGNGIDLWVGSLPDKRVNAIVCTVDLVKQRFRNQAHHRLHAGTRCSRFCRFTTPDLKPPF